VSPTGRTLPGRTSPRSTRTGAVAPVSPCCSDAEKRVGRRSTRTGAVAPVSRIGTTSGPASSPSLNEDRGRSPGEPGESRQPLLTVVPLNEDRGRSPGEP